MDCPHCGKDIEVKGNAFANADVYNKTNLVVTACCDKPVTISPIRHYNIEKYEGSEMEDDWGNEIKYEGKVKVYKIKATYLSFEEFEVEAESEEQAIEMFRNGEVGDGHNTDFQLHDGPYVDSIELKDQ